MADLLTYTVELAKRHFDQIGFIPRQRYVDELSAVKPRLWHAYENGEPCGFLLWSASYPVLRITQACIQYDAQRRQHGAELVGRLIQYASQQCYNCIMCRVADDIEANQFWQQMGFRFLHQEQGGARRGRKINIYALHLQTAQMQLFEDSEQ